MVHICVLFHVMRYSGWDNIGFPHGFMDHSIKVMQLPLVRQVWHTVPEKIQIKFRMTMMMGNSTNSS